MKLFFDGGCKPNPGKMEVAVVSADGSIKEHQHIHWGTNNEAEWIALLWAMEIAISTGAHGGRVIISGDSKLAISQAQGVWQVKQDSLKTFKKEFDRLNLQFADLRLIHVLRDQNPAGHYIEEISG